MSTESSVRTQTPGPLTLGVDLFPLPAPDLGLYIHIPFCESRCRYCNFYFETGWSSRILERTLDTVLEESRAFRNLMYPHDSLSPLRTIYLGGGTPSVIPPDMLDSFLRALDAVWSPDPGVLQEKAFEANPESLTMAHLEVFARRGVDRLSLGVQTTDEDMLSLLGRKAGRADVMRCLDILRPGRPGAVWAGKVNLDLMVGLPGQTRDALDRDMDALLSVEPAHVSVYTLTLEERTPLERMLSDPSQPALDDEAAEALWMHAAERLEAAGLQNYEVSNFARPGCESRHNLGYWRLDPWLGLGPGAVSTLPCRTGSSPDDPVRTLRLTDPHAFAYSRPGRRGWEHHVEILSDRDFLLEHFITGLRTRVGMDPRKAAARCGLEAGALAGILAPLLDRWEARGLLACRRDDCIALTTPGRMILNLLLEEVMDVLDALA